MSASDSSKLSTASETPRASWLRTSIAYGVMIAVALGAFLLIRGHGETLSAPAVLTGAPDVHAHAGKPDVLFRVLLALAAVILTGQILAKLFAFIGQPPVIGEVVAGILLGPSLIGAQASAQILPPNAAPYLGVIAQLGVILYMFTVGLELHAGLLKQRAHATVATSHASILLPFVLGSLLALYLYPRLSNSGVPFTKFALFMGVAMSITAFPVLARILSDRDMTRTELGIVALGCAAIDDVTAWCLLAFVVSFAKAQMSDGLMVAGWTLLYILSMVFVVGPVLNRVVARWEGERLPRSAVAIVFLLLLASALITEWIGIHAIFGAFMLGAVIPHKSAVARDFSRHLEGGVIVLLLPSFFAFTGMRTRIDLLGDAQAWLMCGLIVLVATVGKFGGTLLAARLTGLNWRNAAALGALMNTRGLMELIVLNIGLDMKVISPELFAMMVLMALATTMLTSPVLKVLVPKT